MRFVTQMQCGFAKSRILYPFFHNGPKLPKSKKPWKNVIPWKFQRYLNFGSRLPWWPMGSFKLVQFKLEAVTGPVSKRTHFRTPKGPSGERPSSVRDPSLPFLASWLCQVSIFLLTWYSFIFHAHWDIGTLGILWYGLFWQRPYLISSYPFQQVLLNQYCIASRSEFCTHVFERSTFGDESRPSWWKVDADTGNGVAVSAGSAHIGWCQKGKWLMLTMLTLMEL